MSRFRLRLQDREILLPDSGELSVGRDAVCDVPLEDRLASRRHAVFRCAPEELEVVDLGSLNGLRVNDVPVKGAQRLGHRDRVQIGGHVFVVLDGRRERRSNAPTTKAAAMRPASRAPYGSPRARPVLTPLDTIEQALDAGDVPAASAAMDAVVARYADASEIVASAELARVTTLLLALAERTREARFFDRIFHVHTARRLVLDGAGIDAIQSALPRLTFVSSHAVDTYLDSMHARAAALSTQDQVRLRRIATVSRRIQQGTSA
jgi:pSer/pThr/pTyr-binding forkhead associated (FHA) protein